MHDDFVARDFTAAGPNQQWLTDNTEQVLAVVATPRSGGVRWATG